MIEAVASLANLTAALHHCRQGMGNRQAALRLLAILKALGPDRYSIKLDVSQYFFSINHRRLLAMLEEVISSPTLIPLMESLLKSHGPFGRKGVGIPIGNVTSQAFANLYLSPIDHLAADRSDVFYVRYMDDMIVTGRDKGAVQDFAALIRTGVASDLSLQIPLRKCMPLGSDPVPFLGYVIDHEGYRPLRRNERRHQRRVGRMRRKGARESRIAQTETSFTAWSRLC